MARHDDKLAYENLTAEEITELDLEELCSICHVTPEFVMELIEHGTIEPNGNATMAIDSWHFDTKQVRIIHTAVRLHHDLEVNHAGIALAVDLLKQIDEMRDQLKLVEHYFSTSKKQW